MGLARAVGAWRPADAADALSTTLLMAIATIVLGIGVIPLNPSVATTVVIAASGIAVVGFLLPARHARNVSTGLVAGVLAGGVIVDGLVVAVLPIFQNLGYQAVVVVLAVIAAHATFTARWRSVKTAIVLVGHLFAMCWMLAATETPPVDVILFQQDASAALLRGVNPYDIRFENIYSGLPVDYYAPELMVGDELAFGFIYPPLSLLLALPGYVITGDYRYGAAVAITATAGLVAFARPSRIATGAAMLVLFAPATQVVLHGGWTEPFAVVLLALTAWTAVRRPASTPVALGLLIAVKQYAAPLLIMGFFALRGVRGQVGALRMLLIPSVLALATVIPFAVWNFQALFHSTVGVHVIQPFRIDALSVPAQLARSGLEPTPSIFGFVLGLVTMIVALIRAPRTVAGFSYVVALSLFAFFLFSKQAFLHYYFFVLVALACGIAATQHSDIHDRPPSQTAG